MVKKELILKETVEKIIVTITSNDNSIYIKNDGEYYGVYLHKKFLSKFIGMLKEFEEDE